MKRIYVNEMWCLGCHLCEYYCAYANSGVQDMVKALKDKQIKSRITVEQRGTISFAVNCRHCTEPLCVKSCIGGAITSKDGVIVIDQSRCVLCYSCIMACPYGALMPAVEGVMQKCELCTTNSQGQPACIQGCPNKAIVFEER
ncbi:MAG: 4Fe-4S dicluster domain-containing protein [Sphaerochaeta sp.]|jgi:carbon-monoxide dehydrogenase iron sulfur subunit|uniref:4Fe-4S dicluster domain-containing protein n=1 Tax=unclassified Sphaerochaeta TaxID=2637943 RepID=UPI000ACB4E7F|nr:MULTISPECIES: 4Fe-4S dicluster domain-containing protein [unclassified Sphaerochaeta]MCK9600363.1 4Fe-4S binding protein [Sphaerochaeta sp.]MDX9824968.1 4Fe-4S binding protein [Sphaerochaeta sp.]MEA4864278.1 4Fe-4S dicluster domain-containing protein [Sphaerochaeta sp.]HBO35294.1 4Fe-4S ferredoxin [Sphaerochaeta sp.]HPE93803.1 4Fe-4S binding protein [Sphaerochaeta sp.]